MVVGPLGADAALRRTHQQALLHEVRLVDVFQRVGVLRQGGRQRGQPHGAAAELHGQKLEDAVVHHVQAQRVDFEEAERLGGHVLVDDAVPAHLRPIAHALEQAVRQTRGAAAYGARFPASPSSSIATSRMEAGTAYDGGQLVGRVVLQAEHDAETVAQGTGQQTGARRGADEGEARQVEADGARRRALPHHDVEGEVLERRVEHLLHHAVQTVDLVDEQDVALLEIREDGSEVARALDGGPARGLDVGAQLVGHHRGERGLAKPRRPREQDVVHHIAARLGRFDEDGERLLDLRLTQVVAETLRAQAAIEREIVLGERRRHRARACVDGRRAAIPPRSGARFEHEPFYFNAVVTP